MSAIAVSASSSLRGNTTWSSRRTCGTVNAADFFPQAAALPDQEVMGQETQRGVVVPPDPPPHFVLVQAHFPFALFNRRLDRPPHPTGPDQLGPPRGGRRVRQICFQFR